MPCYHPLTAYQCADGSVTFTELARYDTVRQLQLPCGQCIGCRLERSRQWAMRCVHEASLYERNVFITLTYRPDCLPHRGVLQYRDFQLFMKRLRREANGVRFYMCGEYGPTTGRPHYHALLFGWDPADKLYWRTSDAGEKCYRSATLERLWPLGQSELGAVTFRSAAYVARYCIDKITGDQAKTHYLRYDDQGSYMLPAEFNHMSLKPGIGAGWLAKWQSDVYPHDYVVVDGRKTKPAKFYDRLYRTRFPDEFEHLKFARETEGRSHFADNTPERLSVKEGVTKARTKFFFRKAADHDHS